MKIYVVIPFTYEYQSPMGSKIRTFTNRDEAVQYSDVFKYVELVTTTLNDY